MIKEGNISFCVKSDSNFDYCFIAEANNNCSNVRYDCANCLINNFS